MKANKTKIKIIHGVLPGSFCMGMTKDETGGAKRRQSKKVVCGSNCINRCRIFGLALPQMCRKYDECS